MTNVDVKGAFVLMGLFILGLSLVAVPLYLRSTDAQPVSAATTVAPPQIVTKDLYRWHDAEVGATCWIFKYGSQYGGISCISDSTLPVR